MGVTSASRIEVSGDAPEYWSWRDQGSVSSVKNQGPCGSCAAFAAMATLESLILEEIGEMVDLSEEHIMECGTGSDDACEGWWTGEFIRWIINENWGRCEMESCYPYTASDDLHCDADSTLSMCLCTQAISLITTAESMMMRNAVTLSST